MNKKIIWITVLCIFIIGIVILMINIQPREEDPNQQQIHARAEANKIFKSGNVEYKKKELSDGILYTVVDTEIKPDFVMGDNYFDTTVNDIFYNSEDYEGKVIEASGMYLTSTGYSFVGRYSTNSLCPTCPSGYSVLEFQLQGDIDRELKDTEDWIKVVGTLEIGEDETSGFTKYTYLKVISLEIMNERGQETVTN